MSQSLTKILIHIVFSTKKRAKLLDSTIQNELYVYMNKVIENMQCHVCAIGGTQDHVHILCALPKAFDITKFIGKIKTATSAWIKTKMKNIRVFIGKMVMVDFR